jgi:hypothetical protein
MPNSTFDIKTLTRGTDITLQFSITSSVAITKAFWTAKRKAEDIDGTAAALKLVTTIATADGQITATGPSVATILIVLDKTATDTFLADLDYEWDLEVFDANNKSAMPIGGIIRFAERQRRGIG